MKKLTQEEKQCIKILKKNGFNESDFNTYKIDQEFCRMHCKRILIDQMALYQFNIDVILKSDHNFDLHKKFYIVWLDGKINDVRIWSY